MKGIMHELTPCHISEIPGEKTRALLVGFCEKAYTHPGGLTIGSAPGGQVAYPVAVVILESGEVYECSAGAVTIDGAEALFDGYCFMDTEGETDWGEDK